ncbi:Innexin inx6 [Armadillidium nasatum]|uniref:Innexin n=1 Tax=Armadillidium nasatum TaxID=96803 RepID=A0A5N5TCZ4_9CRUS|nr:Innexin inx6 [Armadillidium nasatum]
MVLVDLLSAIGGLIRVKESADIDNAVFKLHYKITTTMLFGFCILITANSIVGDPINCHHGGSEGLQDDVVNTYYNPAFKFAGIGPYEEGDTMIYHAYYQWVPFLLFIQGILFYSPHWLWKAWEGRKLDAMVMGLSSPAVTQEERREKIYILTDYMVRSLHRHHFYAFKFFFCEFLNFTNTVFNLWFLNKFLGEKYMSIGIDLLKYVGEDDSKRTDPLIILFPRVTKCNFYLFGPSGTRQNRDILCVLGLNVINEKIFVFLWFWFIFLAIVSALGMIYRGIIYCLPVIRIGLLLKKAQIKYKNALKVLSKHLQAGDCFMLHLLSKNLEFLSFSSLLEEMFRKFDSRTSLQTDVEFNSNTDDEAYDMMNPKT